MPNPSRPSRMSMPRPSRGNRGSSMARPFDFGGLELTENRRGSRRAGKAFPIDGPDGRIAAYLKFFTPSSKKRFDRTGWLIDQRIHTWDADLRAHRSDGSTRRRTPGRQASTLILPQAEAQAVPGLTWLEWKRQIAEGKAELGIWTAGARSRTSFGCWLFSNGRISTTVTSLRPTSSSIPIPGPCNRHGLFT